MEGCVFIMEIIFGFIIAVAGVIAVIGNYFWGKGPKLYYFPEHDTWFTVSEKKKPNEPLKRKFDV